MSVSKDIRLIVADIEGCLSPGKGLPLDLVTLSEIQRYNQSAWDRGSPPITLCTGRSQPFVEAFGQMLAVKLPCVCENGAILYDPVADRSLAHPDITEAQLLGLKSLSKVLEDLRQRIPHRREPGKEICISLNPQCEADRYSEKIEALYQTLAPEVDPELFEVTRSASAVDITPHGISKATGLLYLSEHTGISPDQMLGIGDTVADIPFLRLAGIAAVPSNAQKELAKIANFVSASSAAKGVLEIIRQFSPYDAHSNNPSAES